MHSRRRGPNILSLRFEDLWGFLLQQKLVFWAMCAYLFVEYVRPQQIIPALEGLPLGVIALGAACLTYFGQESTVQIKGLGTWLLLLFTAVVIASSVTAVNPAVSFSELKVWISWVIIYLLIVNVVNTRDRFVFFIAVWLLSHTYMAQGGFRQFAARGFRFATWGIIGAPGWFANSGEFGIAMGMYATVAWHLYLALKPHLSKWRKAALLFLPFMGVMCVIGSSSRGAEVGVGAILFFEAMLAKHRVRTLVAVAVVGGLAWIVMPAEQKARFSSAGEDETSVMRKVYWANGLDMASRYPVLGVGYQNWMTVYRRDYQYSAVSTARNVYTVQLPHNIFIQAMAELGYVGLFVFVMLIGATMWTNARTRALARAAPPDTAPILTHMAIALDGAMLSYIVAGFFVTVLYYPFFWINLALTVALHTVAQNSVRPAVPHRRRMGPGLRRPPQGLAPPGAMPPSNSAASSAPISSVSAPDSASISPVSAPVSNPIPAPISPPMSGPGTASH